MNAATNNTNSIDQEFSSIGSSLNISKESNEDYDFQL
jgi:hypothetical protein